MDLEDMILWVFSVVFVVAIVLLLQGHFIDLTIERQAADVPRAAVNFLNSISSSSDFLVKDSSGVPVKNSFSIPSLSNPPASAYSGCCDTLQYDYLLNVKDLGKNEADSSRNFYVSNLQPTIGMRSSVTIQNPEKFMFFSRFSQCYVGNGYLPSASTERFVNVCGGGKCGMGVASVEIAETPLAQLAFWISRACTESQDFSKRILVDKNDIDPSGVRIDQDNQQVCMRIRDSQKELCKKYVCGSKTVGEKRSNDLETFYKTNTLGSKTGTGCFEAIVEKTNSGGSVVTLPPYKEAQKFIDPQPADFDAWTEKTASKFKAKDNCAVASDDYSEPADYAELKAGKSSIKFEKLGPQCSVEFSDFGADVKRIDGTKYKKLSFGITYNGPPDINFGPVLKDRKDKTCKLTLDYKVPNYWELKTIELDKIEPSTLCPIQFDMSDIKSVAFERGGYSYNDPKASADPIWIDNLFFSR